MFSKACEYGLKAMISIATKSAKGQRTNLKEISKNIDSPEQFTAKILQQLSRNKLIHSVMGAHGGFEIREDEMKKLKLIDIVKTIDGDKLFVGCGLGLKECDANKPCPIHHRFIGVRNDLTKILSETSLLEMSNDVNGGLAFLNR